MDGVPEEIGMDKVLSDLHALKKLYGLLQRLDETSKALMKKLLDDALLKQAKALTTASDSVIPFCLGLTVSPKKIDQESSSFLSKSCLIWRRLRVYRLLHKGPAPADENLDEASRALLMKILEDATQEAVRRQAKMLSGCSLVSPALERKLSTQSDCRTQHADPRPRPVASPIRPSLLASEPSRRRLNLQHSAVSRRSGLHVDAHHHAPEEPLLARLATNRSTRTALPARHRPSQDQRHSSLSLHRFPVAGTSRHGTVAGSSTRLADRRDSIRRSSGRGDRCSLERSSSSSSRRSVSRELSLGPSSRLHDGRATPRHVGAESSSSVRLFERLDSGLSLSMTSRHGVERAGHGVSTPERSSSSNTVATVQSRIRPSSTLLTERSLRRRFAVEGQTSRGRQQGSDVSSVDMYSSMSASPSLSASTGPTASPAPRAFANPYYYYSPPVTAPRGIAPPACAPEVSRSMRRRRRQEILEKRVARLRMLKDKIATVFHHRHDHHHHHHHLEGGQKAGPSSRSVVRGAGHLNLNSPWQYLTSMFHRAKGKDKNTRSRTVVGVPEKRRGGGGNMHALFDAVRRHLKGKRRAPAGIKLRRKASRVFSRAGRSSRLGGGEGPFSFL